MKTLTANRAAIEMWAKRNKCFMCKHRFDKALILPVDKPKRGKLQPKFNMEFLFHVKETHGLPEDVVMEWIMGSIYGIELSEFGMRRPDDEDN